MQYNNHVHENFITGRAVIFTHRTILFIQVDSRSFTYKKGRVIAAKPLQVFI